MLYGIIVRTPFGRFNGKMDLEINDGKVSGMLSFMDFSSEFHGEGDIDGFSFSGSFDIPIGSLDYKAEASVKDFPCPKKAIKEPKIFVYGIR